MSRTGDSAHNPSMSIMAILGQQSLLRKFSFKRSDANYSATVPAS